TAAPSIEQFYSTFVGTSPARAAARDVHDCPASVARMERSDIRGLSVPHFAPLNAGYGYDRPRVVPTEGRHRQRSPQGRRHLGVPHFRPLRRVVVPGARVEIAEFLVLELIELDVELDVLVVGVAVVDRDVVARAVPHRPPVDGDFTQREELA